MTQRTAWVDQNIGDWINDRIAQWRGSNQEQDAFNAAQKHLEARANVLSNTTLPPGYEMEMYHRSWYGTETNITVRSPNEPTLGDTKPNEPRVAAEQQQSAVREVLSKNDLASAQAATEQMNRNEEHDKASQAAEQEQAKAQEQTQAREHEQGMERERDHER